DIGDHGRRIVALAPNDGEQPLQVLALEKSEQIRSCPKAALVPKIVAVADGDTAIGLSPRNVRMRHVALSPQNVLERLLGYAIGPGFRRQFVEFDFAMLGTIAKHNLDWVSL